MTGETIAVRVDGAMLPNAAIPMKRGRPRQFDEAVVLDRAMGFFWGHGYRGAGLAELPAHLDLGRQSFYDTFGSKRQIHVGAPGVPGGVDLGVPSPWTSPKTGSGIVLSASQESNLLAGNWHLNIHTQNFGGGRSGAR